MKKSSRNGQSAILGLDDVFPDPGMTFAAIDRLVQHSTIAELLSLELIQTVTLRLTGERTALRPAGTCVVPVEAANSRSQLKDSCEVIAELHAELASFVERL